VAPKLLQISPEIVDIAFVDRAGWNYDLFIFRNLYLFAAQFLGEEQRGLMTKFVRILYDCGIDYPVFDS